MKVPQWLRTDVLDVRRVVSDWAVTRDTSVTHASVSSHPLSSLESRPSFPVGFLPRTHLIFLTVLTESAQAAAF
jgi:hypothetical protein